jgi:Phytanoyl-CoA dioxygenase (PhyH)
VRVRASAIGSVPPSLETEGFALITRLVGAIQLDELRHEADRLLNEGGRHGARNILTRSPALREFIRGDTVMSIVEDILGPGATAVRGIIFDKLMEANWMVGWHQDLTVAVEARHECPGFSAWTVKEGVPHVQPPAQVLQAMVTLRLHLDDCDGNNGALMVLPGSHRHGRLSEAEVDRMAREIEPVICAAKAGDVLLLRPLTAHASRRSTSERRRRVLHLEFASGALPPPLCWNETVS